MITKRQAERAIKKEIDWHRKQQLKRLRPNPTMWRQGFISGLSHASWIVAKLKASE